MDQPEFTSPFVIPTLPVIALEGERHVPSVRRYNAAMHLGHMASYREALRYAFGRKVLDVGCGTGYGSFFLASYSANQVEAIDNFGPALDYARQVYAHPRLTFKEGDALELPYPDETFDFVFSSQVIEHVPSSERFLQEINRVLRSNGFGLITTPNKYLFSPSPLDSNPFHINEMSLNEYQKIGESIFPRVVMRGIPQNCLEMLEGSQIPTLKPDSQIDPDDYQVQDDNLETCENLLMYAHKDPEGEFTSTLPQGLMAASEITAPIFYDPEVQELVCMGLHPFNDQAIDSVNVDPSGRLITFLSPLEMLYRVELDLKSPAKVSFLIEISSKSGKRLAVKEYPLGSHQITLTFSPFRNSQIEPFHILIKPDQNKFNEEYPSDAIQILTKLTSNSGHKPHDKEVLLRIFHMNLPIISG
jgi:ubiquinone/menaquinone biosynthesis C-methylase UbiE